MTEDTKIAQVFIALRGMLRRTVAGIVPPKDVEDIVQEAYVRACQANSKGARHSPHAFLFTVARNLALDHSRRAERRLVVSSSDHPEELFQQQRPLTNETLERAISNEEFGDFCRVVRQLPTNQRRAFVLKKVYGFSQREIAEEMQISEKTVERHISLAMKKCFERLRPAVGGGSGEARSAARGRSTNNRTGPAA